MSQVNKISSFKSFTEVKNQEATMKLRETNNVKRQETVGKIESILDEMGLTSLSELDEVKKQTLINKMFSSISEDELTKIREGNAFGAAVKKAKDAGKKEFEFEGETLKVEEALDSLNEARVKAATLLQELIDGNTSRAEGTKMSKDLAEHYLYWLRTSPYGKKNTDLPLYMLIKASFSWGIERGLSPKLKVELEALKSSQMKNESVESIDEARTISKIQYDWSKVTTQMQATAQNWKAAEGAVKESLLEKLKEMTAQKKALEAELDAAIADKDKDLELVVTEAFNRLPKDVIGTELYTANKNLQSFYSRVSAGNDVDPKDLDVIIKLLQQVKSLTKKFNKKEEVVGTVYEAKDNALQDYVDNMSQKTFKGGGNGQNLLDNAMELAGHIDDYSKGRDTRGYEEDGFYGPTTVTLFKRLVDQMSADDIKNNQVDESVVNEAAAKQFDVDFNNMVRNIKSGYGWIDPEYVGDTWENSSDSIDFELVKGEIYKRLIAAKLLAFADDEDEEAAGQFVKSLKELGIKESLVNEAEIKSDDEFKEYAMTVLKKAFGDDFDEAKAGEVVDGILKKCDGDYGACVGMLTSSLGESVVTEAFDANYWEDYHEDAPKITNPSSSQIQQEVEDAVEDWNDNNENGEENEVTSAGEKIVLKLAKEFAKAKGYICRDVIDAMIAQES